MNEVGSKNIFKTPKRYKFITSPHKLDGYDSSILEDRAYLDLSDTVFRLEYQISLMEENLAVIISEIAGAKSIDDEVRLKILNKKKTRIERKLKLLMFEYGNLSVLNKIIGFVSSLFKKKKKNNDFKNFVMKNVLAKVSKKMNMMYSLKLSLDKLSNINSSVDELISMQTPSKDSKDRYERLTSYITKANDIHNEIRKNINL